MTAAADLLDARIRTSTSLSPVLILFSIPLPLSISRDDETLGRGIPATAAD